MRFPRRLIVCIATALFFVTASFSHARAQYKIELQTCEDLKITKKQYGINIVETATCVNPTKALKPKGRMET